MRGRGLEQEKQRGMRGKSNSPVLRNQQMVEAGVRCRQLVRVGAGAGDDHAQIPSPFMGARSEPVAKHSSSLRCDSFISL